MALSDAQKYEVLRLLCYPHGTIDPSSYDFSNIVTNKLNAIAGEPQVQVEKILGWIDTTEDQLDQLITTQRVKKVDDIEFFDNSISELRKDLNKYVRNLSTMTSIPSKCGGASMGCIVV